MNDFKITDKWLLGIKVLCELEAQKACNAEREAKGLAQAYGESAFYFLADKIDNIIRM